MTRCLQHYITVTMNVSNDWVIYLSLCPRPYYWVVHPLEDLYPKPYRPYYWVVHPMEDLYPKPYRPYYRVFHPLEDLYPKPYVVRCFVVLT